MTKLAEVFFAHENPQKMEVFPSVLYKLRDWSNPYHKKILTNQELYVPNALSLNDPFDSNIKIRFKSIPPPIEKLYKELEKAYKKKNFYLPKPKLLEISKAFFPDGIIENFKNFYEKKRENEILENNNKNVGIVSLSAQRENILMWSHYSNGHRGFAVGFNTTKLANSIGNLLIQTFLTSVIYTDDYPEIEYFQDYMEKCDDLNLFKCAVTAMATKSIWWAYEEEYRLLIFKKVNTSINFPADSVKEVLLGFQIDEISKKEIINICKTNFPLAEIYVGQRHKSKFEIYFEKYFD
jgi:hypothetical protein